MVLRGPHSPQDATEGTTWTCSGGSRGGNGLSVVCSVTTCQGGGEAGGWSQAGWPQPCLPSPLPASGLFTLARRGQSWNLDGLPVRQASRELGR
jgi:hypothetical protein